VTPVRRSICPMATERSLKFSYSSPPVLLAMLKRASRPFLRWKPWSAPARRPPMSTAWIWQSARRNSSSIFSTAFCERVSPNWSSEPVPPVDFRIRSLPVAVSASCSESVPVEGPLPAIREASKPSER
jgi:hypothetical protein